MMDNTNTTYFVTWVSVAGMNDEGQWVVHEITKGTLHYLCGAAKLAQAKGTLTNSSGKFQGWVYPDGTPYMAEDIWRRR